MDTAYSYEDGRGGGGLSPPPEHEVASRRVREGVAHPALVAGFAGFDRSEDRASLQVFEQTFVEPGQVSQVVAQHDTGVLLPSAITLEDVPRHGRARRASFYDPRRSLPPPPRVAETHRRAVFRTNLSISAYIPLPLSYEVWTEPASAIQVSGVSALELRGDDFAFCYQDDGAPRTIVVARTFATTCARKVFDYRFAYDCGTSVLLREIESGPESPVPEILRRETMEEDVLRRAVQAHAAPGNTLPNAVPVLVRDWASHPAFAELAATMHHIRSSCCHPREAPQRAHLHDLAARALEQPLFCLLTIRRVDAGDPVILDAPIADDAQPLERTAGFRRACCARSHAMFANQKRSVWDVINDQLFTSAGRSIEYLPYPEQIARAIFAQGNFSDELVLVVLRCIPHDTTRSEYYANIIRLILQGHSRAKTVPGILEDAQKYAGEYLESCVAAMSAFKQDTEARDAVVQSQRTVAELNQRVLALQAQIQRLERQGGAGAGAGDAAGGAAATPPSKRPRAKPAGPKPAVLTTNHQAGDTFDAGPSLFPSFLRSIIE